MAKEPRKNSRPRRRPPTQRELVDNTGKIIQALVSQISEHATSVQVVGTILQPNGSTVPFAYGLGDIYARLHISGIWLDQMEAMVRGE